MKPIAWRHMTFQGAVGGAIGGAIFAVIVGLAGLGLDLLFILAGAQIGMLTGMVLGVIGGITIERLLPLETRHFNQHYRRYAIMITIIVMVLSAILTMPLVDIVMNPALFPPDVIRLVEDTVNLRYIPSILAAAGSAIATRGYLKSLRKYTLPPRKSKQVVEKIKRLEIPQRQTIDDYLYSQPSQQRRQEHE